MSEALSAGEASGAARVLLTAAQLEGVSAESLRDAWRSQDAYIDRLESLNRQLEGNRASIQQRSEFEYGAKLELTFINRLWPGKDNLPVTLIEKNFQQNISTVSSGNLERGKEVEDRVKQQYAESQHREKVLVRRLAAKEQEIQDYASQITELKASHASLNGRPTLLDPAVNLLILRLKQELTSTRAKLEETQNELSAWKFTPDSNTGKKLMAKCRLLHQENEDLGRMTSSGRIAKLEGDLALQKSFSEEVKKSQSELDEFLQELDEDVEGMQSTVLLLQRELRAARSAAVNGAPGRHYRAGSAASDASEPPAPPAKRRRASVLSLDYNEDEEPLTVTNGDADVS